MFEDWTFGKRVGAGFAFAAAVLVLFAVVGFRSASKVVDDNTWVQHTHEVRTTLSELISLLKDVETGARGYVITGEPAFLEPYVNALGAIDANVAKVRTLTSDNSLQQARIAALGPLVAGRLAEAKQVVEARQRDGYDVATKLVAAGAGKRLMDGVRTAVGEMDREEARLLQARSKRRMPRRKRLVP